MGGGAPTRVSAHVHRKLFLGIGPLARTYCGACAAYLAEPSRSAQGSVVCLKSRSRVSTSARRPEDYVSQGAERGSALGEASLLASEIPRGPCCGPDSCDMAHVVRNSNEMVPGSKSLALITYPGSPATHIARWATVS